MTVEPQALIAAGDARKTELVEMAGGLYALSEGHRQLNGLRQVRSSSTVSLDTGLEIRLLGFGPVRSVIHSLEREVDHGSLLFSRSAGARG